VTRQQRPDAILLDVQDRDGDASLERPLLRPAHLTNLRRLRQRAAATRRAWNGTVTVWRCPSSRR
jgi:hypothetical protein